MKDFLDVYKSRPSICEQLLLQYNVKITPKFNSESLKVLIEDNDIHYHGYTDEHYVGPEIDEYTRLFSKQINYAISKIEKNKDLYLKNYNLYAFEVVNDKMLLTGVLDDDNNLIRTTKEIRTIADCLETDVIPTIYEGILTNEQANAITNILESNIPEGQEFIDWIKQWFSEYEYFPENFDDLNINGLVFTFDVDNKIVEYKLIDPSYIKLLEDNKKANEATLEKNKDIYENICNIFINHFESYKKDNIKNWLTIIEEAFLNMMKEPKTYNKLMNLGSKLIINENSVQANMVSPQLAKEMRRNGNVYKQLFESFVKLFYNPIDKEFMISEELKERINNILERES